jgi:hypothetical protein
MARKPREGGAMEKVMIRLPPDMLARLKPADGERGMGEEIRRRLDASLYSDMADPKTKALLESIRLLAGAFDLDDPWQENRFSFEVFKAGVAELVSQYQPTGPIEVGTRHMGVAYREEDDPGTAGRMLARFVLRDLIKDSGGTDA